MPYRSTGVDLTTAPLRLVPSTVYGFTVAGANVTDPVPVVIVNESTNPCRIFGSSSTAGIASGLPLSSATAVGTGGSISMTVVTDSIWAATTASTGHVTVLVGRQDP